MLSLHPLMIYNQDAAIALINHFGYNKLPFIFFTDFSGEKCYIQRLNEIDPSILKYNFNGCSNCHVINHQSVQDPIKNIYPKDFETYNQQVKNIIKEIKFGNSFLVNFTSKTPVDLNCSLDQIFDVSKAKYKLFFNNQFVIFSPEIFIQIKEGFIYSYPMKGTIDNAIENAGEIILRDKKEFAEHITIVDLIRNDMSTIAEEVKVERFRYIDKIKTSGKELLQVSSKIAGKLHEKYNSKLGNIIFSMLPSGSISGAPKQKTIDIIQQNEDYERGFFTGICGYFDGQNLDSGVMIRFIENENGRMVYKSGGGITALSDPKQEYEEMINKIYVPIY